MKWIELKSLQLNNQNKEVAVTFSNNYQTTIEPATAGNNINTRELL